MTAGWAGPGGWAEWLSRARDALAGGGRGGRAWEPEAEIDSHPWQESEPAAFCLHQTPAPREQISVAFELRSQETEAQGKLLITRKDNRVTSDLEKPHGHFADLSRLVLKGIDGPGRAWVAAHGRLASALEGTVVKCGGEI